MKKAMGIVSAIVSNAIVLVLVMLGQMDAFEALLVFWFEAFSIIVMVFFLVGSRSFWMPQMRESRGGDIFGCGFLGSFVAFFAIVILALLFEFQKKAQGIDTNFKLGDFSGPFFQTMDILFTTPSLWPAVIGVVFSNFSLLKGTVIEGTLTQNDKLMENGFLMIVFSLFRILWLTGASIALVSVFESLLPMIIGMTIIKIITDIMAIKKIESRVAVPPHIPG